MNKDLIKIIKPTPKAQPKDSESELQPASTQPQEISLPEELLETEPESMDVESEPRRYAQMNPSGWKVSDVLREIRLDNF
ncbi:MAG: hypothetical protein PUP92_36850 [Rhizonema sp. PD38]|nr:hypothetical protein [Rhizonema sp. PD38]